MVYIECTPVYIKLSEFRLKKKTERLSNFFLGVNYKVFCQSGTSWVKQLKKKSPLAYDTHPIEYICQQILSKIYMRIQNVCTSVFRKNKNGLTRLNNVRIIFD